MQMYNLQFWSKPEQAWVTAESFKAESRRKARKQIPDTMLTGRHWRLRKA